MNDALISLVLFIVVTVAFGDVLLMLICRALMLWACFWVALRLQHGVAKLLLDIGLFDRPRPALALAFAVLLLTCWTLLRAVVGRVRSHSMGDAEAVALDAGRIALVSAIGLAVLVTLLSLASDTLVVVSWLWLTILAVLVAGLDVCCPSVLSGAAKWFE